MNTVINRIPHGLLKTSERVFFLSDAKNRGEYILTNDGWSHFESWNPCSTSNSFPKCSVFRLNLKSDMWVCIGRSKSIMVYVKIGSIQEGYILPSYAHCNKTGAIKLEPYEIESQSHLTAVTNKELAMLEKLVKPKPTSEELVNKWCRPKAEPRCVFLCVKYNDGCYYDPLHSYYRDCELVPPAEILKMHDTNSPEEPF